VLALHLPDGLGSDLIQPLRAGSPRAEAAIIRAELEPASVARAVHDGAAAVLENEASVEEVPDAVRRLHAGDTVLPRDAGARLLSYDRLRRDRARRSAQPYA
jgi:DNA-binding NarL/FixJ family response regulator